LASFIFIFFESFESCESFESYESYYGLPAPDNFFHFSLLFVCTKAAKCGYSGCMKRLTKKAIDKAIAHTGLELTYTPGDGYFYFLNENGDQIGESVYVCRMNHLTLEQWVEAAESRKAEADRERAEYAPRAVGNEPIKLAKRIY
jgi:hypothetical protein